MFPPNVFMQLPLLSRVLLNFRIPIICDQSIIMKILTVGTVPVTCDVLVLIFDRSPQRTVFERLQSVLFVSYERPNYSPI